MKGQYKSLTVIFYCLLLIVSCICSTIDDIEIRTRQIRIYCDRGASGGIFDLSEDVSLKDFLQPGTVTLNFTNPNTLDSPSEVTLLNGIKMVFTIPHDGTLHITISRPTQGDLPESLQPSNQALHANKALHPSIPILNLEVDGLRILRSHGATLLWYREQQDELPPAFSGRYHYFKGDSRALYYDNNGNGNSRYLFLKGTDAEISAFQEMGRGRSLNINLSNDQLALGLIIGTILLLVSVLLLSSLQKKPTKFSKVPIKGSPSQAVKSPKKANSNKLLPKKPTNLKSLP